MIKCCKDCINRRLACHDTCEIYMSGKQAYNAIKETRLSEKIIDRTYIELARERKKKWLK